jgi:hypothetical protein
LGTHLDPKLGFGGQAQLENQNELITLSCLEGVMIYNYSSYAIDDFLVWSRRYEKMGSHHTANMYRIVANLLKDDAVKFALPDGGRLFTVKHPFFS